jgi:hypothetical protein
MTLAMVACTLEHGVCVSELNFKVEPTVPTNGECTTIRKALQKDMNFYVISISSVHRCICCSGMMHNVYFITSSACSKNNHRWLIVTHSHPPPHKHDCKIDDWLCRMWLWHWVNCCQQLITTPPLSLLLDHAAASHLGTSTTCHSSPITVITITL